MLNTNTPNYDNFIMNAVYPSGNIPNPYFSVDPELTMDYRFLPDHFTISWEGYTVELSYLVSHLDGISYNVVKSIIDKSKEPDMSGTAAWIVDNEPAPHLNSDLVNARNKLEELGFNVVYDNTDNWLTSYEGEVMGYTSMGTHAEDGNCEWEDSAWVKDSLHFDLANGSIFNTYESFNGNSLTTLNWRYVARPNPNCHHTQGLATQFTEIGGTGTMGHAWEPGTIAQDAILFPAYQLGYGLVDAFYQSLEKIAGRNVLVGDPLTRIYECENTVITTNTTIGSGDYQCNVIVPQNVVLTIESGATINFSRNAALKVYGTLIVSNNASLYFRGYSRFILESASNFTPLQNTSLNFEDHSTMTVNSNIVFGGNAAYSFYDDSKITLNALSEIQGTFNMNLFDQSVCITNSSMTLVQNAQFNLAGGGTFNNYGTMLLSSGSVFNINGTTKFYSYKVFKSIGSISNYAAINFPVTSSTGQLTFINVDTLNLDFTKITYGSISLDIDDGIQTPRLISITNSIINSSPNLNLFKVTNTAGVNATLSDTRIDCNTTSGKAMEFSGFNDIQLLRDTIQNIGSGVLGEGIQIHNNNSIDVKHCQIYNFKDGIKQGRIASSEIDEDYAEEIRIYGCKIQGRGTDQGFGISIGYDLSSINAGVKIDSNNVTHFTSCIAINNPNSFPIDIKTNSISNYGMYGILLNGGSESTVKNNNIIAGQSSLNNCTGISVTQVNNPSIIGNTINAQGVSNPGSGIVSISSNGEIRKNTIQYHHYGIELGSSSPNIAENSITDNKYYGIYISRGSFPDLGKTTSGEYTYPLTGYNTIRENGLCENNNAELYFIGAGAYLNQGCNTIADDRENGGGCDYTLLMDGAFTFGTIEAKDNYWGDHPVYGHDPSHRFGSGISVNYDPYLEEPCTFTPNEDFLVLRTSGGIVIDTVYSSGTAPTELTDLQTRYKNANGFYYANQYSQAKQEYEGIIQNYGSSTGSLQAYNRLYTLANLMSSSQAEFNQLKDFYLQKAGNQTDSLMIETITHLSDLCLVSAEEYLPAINNFDEIAQRNPNTDIALYRQIDALTTALLLPQDSTLNKGILGKYGVNNLSDYTNKLSELLRTRGRNGVESNTELLPTEYNLYQNYPNPFNPTTTIKYDLPNTSDVTLAVYDILGRKVKELVNTKQQAGRYEVQFNASSLASGVYIYQLIAEKYMQSRKMILLK